jgi:prophage antirepressor-like protein
MTRHLDEDEKSNRQIGGLGPQTGGRGVIVISESCLYSAILGSTKLGAKAVEHRRARHEVIPVIRKLDKDDKGLH